VPLAFRISSISGQSRVFPPGAESFPHSLDKCSLRPDLPDGLRPGRRPFPCLSLIRTLGPVPLFDLLVAFELNPFPRLAGDL